MIDTTDSIKNGNNLYMFSNEKTFLLSFSQNPETQCTDSMPVEASSLGKLSFQQRVVRDSPSTSYPKFESQRQRT
jgi:hypothetical protein